MFLCDSKCSDTLNSDEISYYFKYLETKCSSKSILTFCALAVNRPIAGEVNVT